MSVCWTVVLAFVGVSVCVNRVCICCVCVCVCVCVFCVLYVCCVCAAWVLVSLVVGQSLCLFQRLPVETHFGDQMFVLY